MNGHGEFNKQTGLLLLTDANMYAWRRIHHVYFELVLDGFLVATSRPHDVHKYLSALRNESLKMKITSLKIIEFHEENGMKMIVLKLVLLLRRRLNSGMVTTCPKKKKISIKQTDTMNEGKWNKPIHAVSHLPRKRSC